MPRTTAPRPSSGTWAISTSGPLRAASFALVLLAAAAPGLAAQRYWRSTLYRNLSHSPCDGLWIGLHYGRYSPVGFVERPEPNFASINLDAGASTQGSYALVVDAQAPAWWVGWRAGLTFGAVRVNRLGYYGLGNDTQYSRDSLTTAGSYFYKVSRTTQFARATVQRRVIGPLRILAGASIDHSDFRALPGRSVFRNDLAAGVVDTGTIPFTDKVLRAGIVLDTRDNEMDPHRGVAAEALFASGTGYTRTTTSARVYVHPFRRLVLAGRLAAGGAELAARLLRNSLLVLGYGHGSDGGRFLLGTSWSY